MTRPSVPSRWRLRFFRTVTALTVLLLLLALPNLLAPWWDGNLDPSIHVPELARWHKAVEASGDAAALVVLVGLLRRPSAHPLVVASLGISAVVAAALVLPFTGPSLLFILLPVTLIVASYPYPGLLRGLPRASRPVWPLVAVAASAALALAVPVATALGQQLAGVGDAAASHQAATYAEHLTTLVLTCGLAATGAPGWRWFTGVLAARLAYLGVVAIALPAQPDSWGVGGGLAALAAALVCGTVVLRSGRRPVPTPAAVPA